MAKPTAITIPTEPIGSIPRPVELIKRITKSDGEDPSLEPHLLNSFIDLNNLALSRFSPEERRRAMSVKSLWITTAAESHDVLLTGVCRRVRVTVSGDSFRAASGLTVAAASRRRTRWIPLMIV